MIKFTYGADLQVIDVTERAKEEFLTNNELKIVKTADFNRLFGDPLPNKVKQLQAIFDDKTTLTFPEQRQKTYTVTLMSSKPKRIMQYWNGVGDERMPDWALHNSEVLKYHHRDFEYQLFNRRRALEFLRKHFSSSVVVAFCKCSIPAMQSDFFRYCYLFAAGGFYFDLKTQCLRRFLDEHLDEPEEMLLLTRSHELLFNGFIGARAGAVGLKETIAECVDNILKEKSTELYLTTGTPILTKQCKLSYGDKYERAQTMNYELNCPIVFGGDKYASEHWSTVQNKQSIYQHIDLRALLQVDDIYVLNLDNRKDRLEQCVAEFAKLGPYQTWGRFPACRGSDPVIQARYPQEYAGFSQALAAHDKRYVDGAFGCLASHYEMIKTAKERGYKRILILEDDFEATDLLFDVELLTKIASLTFDMFYLSFSQMEEPLQTPCPGINKATRALSTGAYIIDRSIFDLVLSQCMQYNKQIDIFYAEVVQKQCHVLCTERCAIIQRESFSDIVQQNIKYRFE